MNFDDAAQVEQVCYEMKLADYPRGTNRARINDLFNGLPPYTPEEVQSNGITVNVNFLEPTRLSHDARAQFYGAFIKPGRFFTATTDSGPSHKRRKWSEIVTAEANRVMKRSLGYFEAFRSKFALDVLHGIGPSHWDNPDSWEPEAIGVEDLLVPSRTKLTMRNLPFFAIYRSYTAPELIRMTRGPKMDAGWNKSLVDSCLEWIDRETLALMGSNWPEVWAPEKMAERIKGDGGWYAGDQVPTIDCFDFYFLAEDDENAGWRRRIILDSWSTPHASGKTYSMGRDSRKDFARNQFLYNSGDRLFARKRESIFATQFADLSAVAPFTIHSVRGLGFLLYAVCHLQNRLRCKFSEAVFENLLMYMRVKSLDDAERALKIELANRGLVDESVQFLSPAERWQPNYQLAELGLRENASLIGANMASFQQPTNFSPERERKTKFQVMAEMNAVTQLVGAAIGQAYAYQKFEDYEILRRLMRKNSKCSDVRGFRAQCLTRGLPEELLDDARWEVEHERVIGSGNKTLEMAITEQLMTWRPLFDPDPQRVILRDAVSAVTDDPARADSLVPQQALQVSDSIHDAQLAAGTLMQGLPVSLKTGQNHGEYVQTLLVDLQLIIGKFQQAGMAPPDKIEGMDRIAMHIVEHLQVMAQDKDNKAMVAALNKQLMAVMNMVKAFKQRLMEAMKKSGQAQAPGNGEAAAEMAKTQAKIQAQTITAQAKAQNTREAHAQRTAQRQIQFREKIKQDEQRHRLEMAKLADKNRLEMARQGADFAASQEQARQDAELAAEIAARESAAAETED